MRFVCKKQVYIEGSYGWFIDEIFNQIFQIDLLTNTIKYIDSYEGVRFNYNSRKLVKKLNNDIYIFPLNSKENIIVYDLEKGIYTEIEMGGIGNEVYSMIEAWETEEELIVYSWRLHKILKISKSEKRLIACYELSNKIHKFGKFKENENSVHTIFVSRDELIKVDFIEGSISRHFVKDLLGIVYVDNFLWISYNSQIWVYNLLTDKIVSYIDIPYEIVSNKESYSNMEARSSENFIWYIPNFTNKFMYINKKSKIIKYLILEEEKTYGIKNMQYLINFVWKNRYLYLYSIARDKNFIIDMEKAEYRDIDFDISNENYQIVMQHHQMRRGEIGKESEDVSIDLVISYKYCDKKTENIQDIGNTIYSEIKKI